MRVKMCRAIFEKPGPKNEAQIKNSKFKMLLVSNNNQARGFLSRFFSIIIYFVDMGFFGHTL